VAGHPEGFHEALPICIPTRLRPLPRAGQSADPLALHFPNGADGLQGIRFVDAVVRSSQGNGVWTPL
jgi:hypothetical protein